LFLYAEDPAPRDGAADVAGRIWHSRRIWSSLRDASDDQRSQLVRLLIIFLGTWAFLALAHEVRTEATQDLDERVMLATRRVDDPGVPIGPAWVQDAARDITALGGYSVLILLVAMVAGFLHLHGKRGEARFLVAAAISGYLVGSGLKAYFVRPRPTVVPHLQEAFQTSFPSGHSMMSAIIYLTLGALLTQFAGNLPRLRIYFLLCALLLTGIVGISRVYLGVHYPTDVLAGWTAGLVWANLCSLVAARLQRRGVIEDEI
jgi:undecaprenyl-diphosphatase